MTTATTQVRTTEEYRAVERPWVVVAVREMVVKLTDRNFLISTGITVALIAGFLGLGVYMDSRSSDWTVAVVDADAAGFTQAADELVGAGDSGDRVETLEVGSAEEARQAVRDEDADAALLRTDGWVMVGSDEVDPALARALTDAVRTTVMDQNAAAAGTSVAELAAGSEVRTELLDTDLPAEVVRGVSFVFTFLFYMAAIMFGMAIATSVLEEKQNRVVEILATAIPVRQLLYGKVVGNSALAIGQIALYAVVGLVGVNLAGIAADVSIIVAASGWFVAFFVAGFVALASVWAVLGSMASRSEDLQTSTGPVLMVIMAALGVGLFVEGTGLVVASFVPVISSVAMPIRVLAGEVPVWQPVVALALTLVAAYLLLRLGEKIYQRAVMQTGTALSWRQALRLED